MDQPLTSFVREELSSKPAWFTALPAVALIGFPEVKPSNNDRDETIALFVSVSNQEGATANKTIVA